LRAQQAATSGRAIGEIGALPRPNAVLMFTRANRLAKGVMHCLKHVLACNIALAGRFGLDANDTMLVCSPLGIDRFRGRHAARIQNRRSCLPGHWEPKRGIGIWPNEGVTFRPAPRRFSPICVAVAAGAAKPARLRKFLLRRCAIPPALIDRVYANSISKSFAVGHDRIAVDTLTEPERALEIVRRRTAVHSKALP